MRTPKRPHYAWLICLGGALSFCAGMGLASNLFSLCLPDIILEHGLTNTQGSWLTTTRSLLTLAAMLVINHLCARFGLRIIMSLGCALISVAYLSLYHASSFSACCFSCVLLGIGYCMCGPVPVSLLLGRWFSSRRNLALGLSSAGSGIITIVAPPILTWIQGRSGLSACFLTLSILALVLCLALWLLIRNTPQELFLSPYYEEAASTQSTPARTAPPPMSALQKGTVFLSSFLMAAPAGPGFSHVAAFFRSEGYHEMIVAALISTLGFVLLAGKIICGQIYDRLGGRQGNLCTFGLLLIGQILFLSAPFGITVLAFLSIIVYGMGMPISSVSTAKWAADLNSEENYAGAVRSINTAYSLGALVFGPVPGMLADYFGSYLPSYILFVFLLVLSFVLLHTVYRQLGVGTRC